MQQTSRSVSEQFRIQARACRQMHSAFYGEMLDCAAAENEGNQRLHDLLALHQNASALPLRLVAAAQFRALRGMAPAIAARYPSTRGDGNAEVAWKAISQDVRANEAFYDAWLARAVQTNEVARALPVLVAALSLSARTGLPLRTFEIGASAGLILNFDRYRYVGKGWGWGDAASPLMLSADADGEPPNLRASLRVVERRGCDLEPLDANDSESCDRLMSFVWPDQFERITRLRAALEIARRYPVSIDAGDAIEWVAQHVKPQHGAVTVLLHTVMAEHMRNEQREMLCERVSGIANEASADSPFAWLRMELSPPTGYETVTTLWPGGDERVIAHSDGHAQKLRWLEPVG